MKYFMMSNRFKKCVYEDFGLIHIDGKFIKKDDLSEWEPCSFFDFGWGEENGYFKKPLGDFNFLMKIIFLDDEEDSYGAASMILDYYPLELKKFIKTEIIEKKTKYDLKRLDKVFNLTNPINRTIKLGMNIDEIENEYQEWLIISKFFIENL